MYSSAEKLKAACEQTGRSIRDMTLIDECKHLNQSEDIVLNELKKRLDVMRSSATNALQKPVYSLSGLTGGNAYKMNQLDDGQSFSGIPMVLAMSYALSTSETNANMGKIVAAPTAGAAGILPAALFAAQERFDYTDDKLIDALLVAAAIGNIIATNATVSGAEGGCQVECGSAAAMAAAALVSLKSDDTDRIFTAASFALINVMGLVCDPVGGLVEFPCALRNAGGVANAMTAADLALAGVPSVVPFDEVVEALYQVGNSMPMQLRETALGGVAAQPSAQQACRNCHR